MTTSNVFSRVLRLPPSFGDWTTLTYDEGVSEPEPVDISEVRQTKFDGMSRENLTYVHLLHHRMGELFLGQLSADLDVSLDLHKVSIVQLPFQELSELFEDRLIQVDLTLASLGRFYLVLDWGLGEVMVDRLSGGEGEESYSETFSDLEKRVFQTELNRLLPLVCKGWSDIFDLRHLESLVSYGAFSLSGKGDPGRFTMISLAFSFGGGESRHMMLVYPNEVLRELVTFQQGGPHTITHRVKLSSKTLQGVKVPVKATLGRTVLSMKEIQMLQVGDVVPLDTSLRSAVELQIGDEARFVAQPGISGRHLALQVLKPEDQDDRGQGPRQLPLPESSRSSGMVDQGQQKESHSVEEVSSVAAVAGAAAGVMSQGVDEGVAQQDDEEAMHVDASDEFVSSEDSVSEESSDPDVYEERPVSDEEEEMEHDEQDEMLAYRDGEEQMAEPPLSPEYGQDVAPTEDTEAEADMETEDDFSWDDLDEGF